MQLYWYDTNLKRHDILDPDKVTFDGFDANIVSFEGFNMKLLAVGETEVTAHYEGVSQTFKVHVKEAGAKISFRAVEETMTVYLKDGGKRHKPQIRGFVVFEDGSWGEAYNDKSSSHPDYPAMVDAGQKKYLMTFDVADETVCKVSKRGIITPKEVGQTTVTVTIGDTHSFTVTVIVEENRD